MNAVLACNIRIWRAIFVFISRPPILLLLFFIIIYYYYLFKNRSCSQEAELQRLEFTKEKFKLIILSITD
jgi:hypothetical protein